MSGTLDELTLKNAEVSDEETARVACLWKWEEIRVRTLELWTWINRRCGYCALAQVRGGTDTRYRARCKMCPEKVKEYCMERSDPVKIRELHKSVGDTIDFLRGLKPDD